MAQKRKSFLGNIALFFVMIAVALPGGLGRAAEEEQRIKQTWYVYGSALLSDQKTVVVTRMFFVDLAVSNPAEVATNVEQMQASLKRELTEHITGRMHRSVISVTTGCDLDRKGVREKRDVEIIDRKKAGKMRTIFLNGFAFSMGDGN